MVDGRRQRYSLSRGVVTVYFSLLDALRFRVHTSHENRIKCKYKEVCGYAFTGTCVRDENYEGFVDQTKKKNPQFLKLAIESSQWSDIVVGK